MFEPTDELTACPPVLRNPPTAAYTAATPRASRKDRPLGRLCPFRATAMELTASGIEVAAARNVTLETIVGICAETFCNANMSEASSHIKSQTAKVASTAIVGLRSQAEAPRTVVTSARLAHPLELRATV